MRGSFAVLGVILLYVLDPVLTWAKKRFLGQDAPPFEPPVELYLRLVYLIPLVSALGCVAHLLVRGEDVLLNVIVIVTVLGYSLMASRYFYTRATGKPAQFGIIVVLPNDPDYANDQLDLLAVLTSITLVATPWIVAFWPRS